ncbi:MAG: sulfotransferase [Actinomycetota bacterium]|nr:sulfotransferase [Actinomycetota bacterium]
MTDLAETMKRQRWTLERFGLLPGDLARRAFDRSAPKVFCVSIPKAGTHLLERAICLHPRIYRKLLPTIGDGNVVRWKDLAHILARVRSGEALVSHLSFRAEFPGLLERNGVRGIFLMRDPRDTVVSQTHFVTRETSHRQHGVFAEQESQRDRLLLSINGDPARGVLGIAERLDRYAGWLSSGALAVRFEDLVGPGGGGDAMTQEAAVRGIYRYLGLGDDDGLVRSVCRRLFSSDSPTFRKGSIGGWTDAFDPELIEIFDRAVGDRADLYGYGSTGPPGPASDEPRRAGQ